MRTSGQRKAGIHPQNFPIRTGRKPTWQSCLFQGKGRSFCRPRYGTGLAWTPAQGVPRRLIDFSPATTMVSAGTAKP